MCFQMTSCHSRVAIGFRVANKALLLLFARASNAFTDSARILFRPLARNIAVFHRWDVDMQINSIEKGTRDSLPISLHLGRTAAALPFEITEISTRARIHRRYQHEFA